jgi:hypothetical protein
MEMILPGFMDESPSMTMHDFEAALFMIGYDITCLAGQHSAGEKRTFQQSKSAVNRLLQPKAAIDRQEAPLETLSHKGKQILLSARADGSYNVIWGDLRFVLEGAALEEIEVEFAGRAGVPLGARVDGNVEGSLGRWLIENGWPSRRYASSIAPILVHLTIVKNVTRRAGGFLLDF